MQFSQSISNTLTQLVQPVIEELGFELIEISMKQENSRNVLEVFIDKENGITVDDCAIVSDKISLLLDVEDFFQHKYYLEVGSPGIFRELKTEKDFNKYLNTRVKAVFNNPSGKKDQFVGIMTHFENQSVTLNDGDTDVTVELSKIKKIHLFPEL